MLWIVTADEEVCFLLRDRKSGLKIQFLILPISLSLVKAAGDFLSYDAHLSSSPYGLGLVSFFKTFPFFPILMRKGFFKSEEASLYT